MKKNLIIFLGVSVLYPFLQTVDYFLLFFHLILGIFEYI